MKSTQNRQEITLEQYRALLDVLSDAGLSFIKRSIEASMPDKHANVDTFFGVMMHIATKAICMICQEDQDARKRAVNYFCEALPELVKDTIIFTPMPANENKH